MIEEMILGQVKSLIAKSITRFAKELSVKPGEIQLYIAPVNIEGHPLLKLLNKGMYVRDLKFVDLMNVVDRLTYSAMGFDAEKDMPVWIQKFILKSHADTGLDIMKSSYIIILSNGELRAFMYFEGKQYKEVSIDYILETR